MSYNDYVTATKKEFAKITKMKSSEIDKYFSEKDTQTLLRQDYESYHGKNLGQVSPASTASCLDMLY